jgi:hypothetical protein
LNPFLLIKLPAADKLAHFAACMILTWVFAPVLLLMMEWYLAAMMAAVGAFCVGYAKEAYDSTQAGNRFDPLDLRWDMYGVLTALVMMVPVIVVAAFFRHQ